MAYTVGILTLGCKVNQYESEALAEQLVAAGFCLSDANTPCDVYIINTCTVTAESDRKSKQMIRRVRNKNPKAFIIVIGCLSQISPLSVVSAGANCVFGSRNKLNAVKAAVDFVSGGNEKSKTAHIEVSENNNVGFEKMEIRQFPRTRAYIKIEDGCESHCTYCIIPRARGKICSKAPDEILSEIEGLISGGCRETVLTGIETASYGIDLNGYRLHDLLYDIDKIAKGKMRIRLGSLDPSLITEKFTDRISGLSSVAPHFHLSMQSGCDRTLARMKRKYNTAMAKNGIMLLRNAIPNVQFTSDFITSFPGETEEDFLMTADFVEKTEFLNSHIFTYSRRAGTEAASMPDQIPAQIGKERTNRLIGIQKTVTSAVLEKEIGKEYEVLFETDGEEYSVGHTPSFIEVAVKNNGSQLHAQIKKVRLTGHSDGIANGIIL